MQTLDPIALTGAPQTVTLPPGTWAKAVLYNQTQYSLRVSSGAVQDWIGPLSGDVLDLSSGVSSIQLVPTLEQGAALTTTTLLVTLYQPGEAVPGQFPVSLTAASVVISGTVTASISGTPNVTITGTPTVIISGTVPVSISGTPNVTISGTPTVNIAANQVVQVTNPTGGSLTIAGTVNIGNTPAVTISGGVTISNITAGTVSINGNVSVQNAAGALLATNQPVTHLLTQAIPLNNTATVTVTPPAGTHAIGIVSTDISGNVVLTSIKSLPSGASYWGSSLSEPLVGQAIVIPLFLDLAFETQVQITLTNGSTTTAATVYIFAILDTQSYVPPVGYSWGGQTNKARSLSVALASDYHEQPSDSFGHSNPGIGVQAIVTFAATTGRRYQVSEGSKLSMAGGSGGGTVGLVVNDGATTLFNLVMGCAGTNQYSECPLSGRLAGNAGNALTIEFNGGVAGVYQGVNAGVYWN